MRKPFIAGNWKMHGTLEKVRALAEEIKQGASAFPNVGMAVCPVFIHLPFVQQILANSAVKLGAQNLYVEPQGAYTGEVSGPMLKEIGCQYVIIGHSERRHIFHESLGLITAKFKAALGAGLTPILCVGETQAEREKGSTESVLKSQIEAVLNEVDSETFRQAIIAYEPVWAIGTGLTATPEQAQAAHVYIRELISKNNIDIAKTIRILYGGSMKADNAAALLAMPDIDGGLIGGASLVAESFLAICSAAQRELTATGT